MKKNTMLLDVLNEFRVSKMEELPLDGTDTVESTEFDDADALNLGDLGDDEGGDDQYGLGPDGQSDGLDDIESYLAGLAGEGEGQEGIYDAEGEGELGLDGAMNPEELGGEEDGMLGDEAGLEGELETQEVDPDFEGTIRTVHGGCLVYKRKGEDGLFEELWIYEVGKDNESLRVRKSILAGTDIDPTGSESEDGTQSASSYSVGNVQYLNIHGLPN